MLELTDVTLVDLSVSDLAHGGGVFETIAVHRGVPLFLDRHLSRMAGGLQALGMPEPPDGAVVRDFIAAFLHERAMEEGALRLLAADGKLMVMTRPSYQPPAVTRVALAERFRRCSGSVLMGIKSAAYLENRMMTAAAAGRGLFDLIALNEHSRLTDGGRCNIFLVVDNRVVTPPVHDGCLPGVVRELLLTRLPIETASIHREQVPNAVAGWVTSSLAGVVPLSAIGDHRLQPDHDRVTEAAACYASLVNEEVDRYRT